jgi:hypothetical protein
MAKEYDASIPGLNGLLRELSRLDKSASGDLRDASVDIATRLMVPAWQQGAARAGPWGDRIAATVKAKRDRLPAVQIGGGGKAFSGGATVNMVRFPSHAGRVRPSIPPAFTRTDWMNLVRPAYVDQAMAEWGKAVDSVVKAFNNGPDF